MKIKNAGFLTILIFVFTALAACGKKNDNETSKVSSPASVSSPISKTEDNTVSSGAIKPDEPEVKEEFKSFLTGKAIDKKYKNKRPYTFMFNNIRDAYPQSGTGKAGILYEALAEGGITRLMGIFDYMSGDKIGSCRSARHYYVDFANEFDSFFIHFGQTKYAVAEIHKLGVDTLSGLSWEGATVFYRDNSIRAPHNAFATTKGIKKAIKDKKYRTKLNKNVGPHFNFSYDNEISIEGEGSFKADYITVPFSAYMTPEFQYEKKNSLYKRYAFGTEHIDKLTGKPLKFKNIFIQLVNEYNIDRKGYQTMDLIGFSGKGYYITGGNGIEVYWNKPDANSKTTFYYDKEHTKEISVNTGKSYYAVFPTSRADMLKFTK